MRARARDAAWAILAYRYSGCRRGYNGVAVYATSVRARSYLLTNWLSLQIRHYSDVVGVVLFAAG